ncbi:hypothetical protein TIFTF001_029398 [Ficus carica]|uniref:Uncharacterized protein n=1 Tax=Ficus carica TaxID=3494 RepID=A0AA88DRI4_FICCA|nr:hypothetical protein TIFTF001_029398 [Ficus carica]
MIPRFIDDAYNGGVPVVILTAYSRSADKIARSITEKLGDERVSKVKIVGNEEVEQSLYSRLIPPPLKGKYSPPWLKIFSVLCHIQSHPKHHMYGYPNNVSGELIKSVVSRKTLMTNTCLEKIIAALRAGAETASLPVYNCVLVAGSQSGVVGAERVGMPCVVLRSSLTSRAQFPSAKAILDGYGGADLTISKLQQKRWS